MEIPNSLLKFNDWITFLEIECENIKQAKLIESYLKRMRNTKYIKWLAENPDAIDKLKQKFSELPGSPR